MADSGWLALAGAIAGGGVAGTIALLQGRHQHRFEMQKSAQERRWQAEVAVVERDRADAAAHREQLLQLYTRYLVAADRLENATRDLGRARSAQTAGSRPQTSLAGMPRSEESAEWRAHDAAQVDYDEVCEIVKLLAPAATTEVVLQQRRLLNRMVREALDGIYDHDATVPEILGRSEGVLAAMRADLGSSGPRIVL